MAVWTVDLPSPRGYEVVLRFACPDGEAGKEFRVECGGERLIARTTATGAWDRYQRATLGTLRLPAGRSEVRIMADERFEGHLMDLESAPAHAGPDGGQAVVACRPRPLRRAGGASASATRGRRV